MQEFIMNNQWIIILIILWSLPWKAAALWKSARRNHFGWFTLIFLINSVGIFDILYIFIFSRKKLTENNIKNKREFENSYLTTTSVDNIERRKKISKLKMM